MIEAQLVELLGFYDLMVIQVNCVSYIYMLKCVVCGRRMYEIFVHGSYYPIRFDMVR